jgi:two-component system, cell cycle sensor histidine kinase and response regulator CckA
MPPGTLITDHEAGGPVCSVLELNELAAIVQSSDDAIVGKTLDGVIRSWNPAAERIFGYSAAEMVGASIYRLIPPELVDEEKAILARIRAGDHVAHYETTRLRKDGERIIMALTISPVRDASGALVGAATIKRDITEQRALEAQLRQAQRMDAMGQLAGGIAHDFNNVLTIIQGFASFLDGAVPASSPGHADLLGIKQAAERATRLTQQLLAFSRQQPAQPEVFDLSGLVQETTSMLRRLLGEHIRLEVRVAASPAMVDADRGQLSQVLLNLALNARDAMPEGGTLTVTTYNDGATSRVILTVRDTGHGMDARTEARAFEPFFTTKPRGQGTGLGLSTVFGIVKKAGGEIEVDTAPGKGTVFRVLLPRAKTIPLAPVRDGSPADLYGTETVLVVEDEEAIAALVTRTLASHGYTAISAGGAGAAMIAFAEHAGRVDLLLTDVVMPSMNGPALAERLRVQDPDLPVLYMSGYTDHAFASGAYDTSLLLPKPFTPTQLLQAVRSTLDATPRQRDEA